MFTVGSVIKHFIQPQYIGKPPYYEYTVEGIDHEENCSDRNNENPLNYSFRTGQKLCVIRALLQKYLLEIHKTSSSFSNQVNIHQLYPEYQRFQRDDMKSIDCDLTSTDSDTDSGSFRPDKSGRSSLLVSVTSVSDCPACIIRFVQRRWMGHWSLKRWHGGFCRVLINRNEQPPSFSEGEIVRYPSHRHRITSHR